MRALLIGIFFSAPFAFAKTTDLPAAVIENINGFEVHFVDTGAGDTAGIGFLVPYGSMNDIGRMMGRAHRLEHVMHIGTVRDPGYHTFDKKLKKSGVNTNAGTWNNKTYYYASARNHNDELMFSVMLGMLGGLEWNESANAQEHLVVFNEIVEESNPTEDGASQYMPMLHLLSSDHPWAQHPMLGGAENLNAMTMADLKDLYDSQYNSKKVKIAVFGNFTDSAALARSRELVKKHLRPHTDAKEPRGNAIPSLMSKPEGVSPESMRRLLIASDQGREGSIMLQIDVAKTNQTSAAASLLTSYLNMHSPGSLVHRLKTELGWITNSGIWTIQFENRILMVFNYYATEVGLEHQAEIEQHFFRALGQIRNSGIDDEILQTMKSASSKYTARATREISDLIYLYAEVLFDQGDLRQQEAATANVSNHDLIGLLNLVNPGRGLYSTLRPDISERATVDPRFNRKFELIDNSNAVEVYSKALAEGDPTLRPILREVNLRAVNTAKQSKMFAHSRPGVETPLRMVLDLRSDLPDNQVWAQLIFAPEKLEELGAVDLVLKAFSERYAGELAYLSMTYFTNVSLSRSKNVLTVSASGDDRNTVGALEWALSKLQDFAPTDEEIQRARTGMYNGHHSAYLNKMTVGIAVETAFSRMDPLRMSTLESRDAVQVRDPLAVWLKLRKKANKGVFIVGDVPASDADGIFAALKKISPKNLPRGVATRLATEVHWRPDSEMSAFTEARPSDGLGGVRIYQGPERSNTKEWAAFAVLTSLLDTRVNNYNRGDQGLGYAHNVNMQFFGTRAHLFMYGQTDGADKSALMIQGWDYVLNQLKSGLIPSSEIVDAIESVYNTAMQAKTSAGQFIAEHAQSQAVGEVRVFERLIEGLRNVTPDDVFAVAQKYLLNPDVRHSQLTLGNCESLLN